MPDKYLGVNADNIVEEFEGTDTSAGAGDAGKIVSLNDDGKIDNTMLPDDIGSGAVIAEASETLAAHDFVNLYDDAGTSSCRKADATNIAKIAHGYVKDNVTSGNPATIYPRGTLTGLTGLTTGLTYVLDPANPGKAIERSAATFATGDVLQVLGEAVSATAIDVDIEDPIIRK